MGEGSRASARCGRLRGRRAPPERRRGHQPARARPRRRRGRTRAAHCPRRRRQLRLSRGAAGAVDGHSLRPCEPAPREAASCGAAKCGTKVLYAEKAERAARKHDGRNDVSRSRRRRLERVTILLDTLLHTGKKRGRVQTRCHGVHKPRDPVNGGALQVQVRTTPYRTEHDTGEVGSNLKRS